MTDIDKPVDAAPVADKPVPDVTEPVDAAPAPENKQDLDTSTALVPRIFDENARPEGIEDNVNVVAEDSEESDLAKDQTPELDDEPVEDVSDEDVDLSGEPEEGV